eukprot:COSAG01_NODE_1348_length_10618_cov_34.156164_2_plen_91_part_00
MEDCHIYITSRESVLRSGPLDMECLFVYHQQQPNTLILDMPLILNYDELNEYDLVDRVKMTLHIRFHPEPELFLGVEAAQVEAEAPAALH